MSLVNWKQCRAYALDYAAEKRAHKFARVSRDVLPGLEAAVRSYLERLVECQPSKGKTIK